MNLVNTNWLSHTDNSEGNNNKTTPNKQTQRAKDEGQNKTKNKTKHQQQKQTLNRRHTSTILLAI